MSQLYVLTVTIPHDEVGFPAVQKLLENMSYTKKYYRAVAYPNKAEYVLGPLSQVGIDNAKTAFRDAFKDATPADKGFCAFHVHPYARD